MTASLWIALAGPVAEELLARGLIFNVLAQSRKWAPRYSAALVLSAAVISSLVFALWHGDAADTLPDRFAMGLILCGVYWWTASLLPAIAVHAVWNLRWFQVAVLGSHPFLLGQWPPLDLLLIAQDPVYRELPGTDGKHVTELRLAVKGMGSGERDAVGYIDVVSYTMTEKAAQTIGTGWLVAVAGRLEHQTWEKDGQKRGKHRIVASRVEFLAAPRNGASEPDVSDFEPGAADDDIPF